MNKFVSLIMINDKWWWTTGTSFCWFCKLVAIRIDKDVLISLALSIIFCLIFWVIVVGLEFIRLLSILIRSLLIFLLGCSIFFSLLVKSTFFFNGSSSLNFIDLILFVLFWTFCIFLWFIISVLILFLWFIFI